MTLQAHALLENLIVAFYLFLVRVYVLRRVPHTTIHLIQRHIALALAAAKDVLRRLLLKLLLRLFIIHI